MGLWAKRMAVGLGLPPPQRRASRASLALACIPCPPFRTPHPAALGTTGLLCITSVRSSCHAPTVNATNCIPGSARAVLWARPPVNGQCCSPGMRSAVQGSLSRLQGGRCSPALLHACQAGGWVGVRLSACLPAFQREQAGRLCVGFHQAQAHHSCPCSCTRAAGQLAGGLRGEAAGAAAGFCQAGHCQRLLPCKVSGRG